MTLDVAGWFSRGQELLVFPSDSAQAAYLQYYQAGNLPAVVAMLERAFAVGPARMPALNWLAFGPRIAALELLTDDGPPKAVEDWAPADFGILPWGGGPAVSPSLVLEAGGAGWGALLNDLCSSFLFLPRGGREGYALALQGAALAASGRACGLSELARAAAAAQFLAAAGPGSPVLRAAAPAWSQAASQAARLASRAAAVASGLWSPVLGPGRAAPFLPLTLYGLRSAASVAAVGELLLGAAGGATNLVQYLACQDYTPPA